MRVAFATSADLPSGNKDDALAAQYVGATYEVWNDPLVDWDSYDRVVVRSTWDFVPVQDEFIAWARRVGPTRLRNIPDVIEFAADKRHSLDLQAPFAPTMFVEPGDDLPTLDGEVVIKPSVSLGGHEVGRFDAEHHREAQAFIAQIQASGRAALVQPYLCGIDTRGEITMVFFGGELSHVVHKSALLRPNEVSPMRSVAELLAASKVKEGEASTGDIRTAERALRDVSSRFGTPLYFRVDMVRGLHGSSVVLEVEAVSPPLYFGIGDNASEKFAVALLKS